MPRQRQILRRALNFTVKIRHDVTSVSAAIKCDAVTQALYYVACDVTYSTVIGRHVNRVIKLLIINMKLLWQHENIVLSDGTASRDLLLLLVYLRFSVIVSNNYI